MKIVLVAPGIVPIPPPGWGAVEILLWDLQQYLQKKYQAEVILLNTPDMNEIIYCTNRIQPDIVHIHYDVFWRVVPYLQCKHVFLTSHYGYLEQKTVWFHGYHEVFQGFVESRATIHCLSEGIKNVYALHGVPPERLCVIPNGANPEAFVFYETPTLPDRTLYLGKIEPRKRQAIYQDIPFVDFVGNCTDAAFQTSRSNYLGEWSKPMLYQNLSKYANLMLLSDGECHPLVVAEALLCGLGVVISEYAAANLDRTLPFVTVIPTDKLGDLAYIQEQTLENQRVSCLLRKEIREYGLQHFSWEQIAEAYYQTYQQALASTTA